MEILENIAQWALVAPTVIISYFGALSLLAVVIVKAAGWQITGTAH